MAHVLVEDGLGRGGRRARRGASRSRASRTRPPSRGTGRRRPPRAAPAPAAAGAAASPAAAPDRRRAPPSRARRAARTSTRARTAASAPAPAAAGEPPRERRRRRRRTASGRGSGPAPSARATRRWRSISRRRPGSRAARASASSRAAPAQRAVRQPDQQRAVAAREPGRPPVMRLHRRGDLLAGAVQAAHDRAGARAQRSRGLLVGQADDVDGDDGRAQRLGELGHRRVRQLRIHRQLGPGALVGDPLQVLGRRRRRPAPRRRLRVRDPDVAEHAQQVREVALALHEPRAPQHPLERLLHEVLGVVARAAHRIRGAQEPRAMLDQPPGVQPRPVRGLLDALFDSPRLQPRRRRLRRSSSLSSTKVEGADQRHIPCVSELRQRTASALGRPPRP